MISSALNSGLASGLQPRINLMFKKVVEDLVANREVNITSRYESQQRNNMVGDFQFIVMEKFLSQDNELPFYETHGDETIFLDKGNKRKRRKKFWA